MTNYIKWLLIFFLVLTACTSKDDTWEKIQESGVLKVGLDPTFPPFEVYNGEEVIGIDADLAHVLAKELDLTVEFVHFGYDGLYDALLTEQADVLISALVIMPERTKDFSYSEPYFNAGEILVIRHDEMGIDEMSDLNGRSLAVELGSQGHVIATEWQRKLLDLSVSPFNTPEDALTAVLDQTTDAALIDHISGRLFLKEHPDLKHNNEPITVEPYAIVVRSGDSQLLNEINDSLKHLYDSGKLDEITNEWLGP